MVIIMTNNEEYWKKRFIELEKSQNEKSNKFLNTLKEEYNKSLAKIEKDMTNWYTRIAENNEVSYANAKKLLDKRDLKEFKWTVEEYIKKGKENAINQKWVKELENASARVHIDKLEAIKIQIQNELELLYTKQNKGIENLVKKQYQDNYYKSTYIIQNGLEKYWNIQALDTNKIQKVISNPWTTDNKTFSDRIWKNKDELLNTLQRELTQATIRGDDIHKVTKKLEKDFEVSKGKAGRLVMTESAFFSSAGQKECFNSLNVKQYEIVATLDSHTSEICQKLDGKVFDMKDYEVGITAPPFHCWCRSVTAPYFDDEFTEGEQRIYRDEEGKNGYVDSKVKYNEWKEKYVKDNQYLKNNLKKDIIYKNVFQRLKGKNIEDIKKDDINEIIKDFEDNFIKTKNINKLEKNNDKRLEIQNQLKEYIFEKTELNKLHPAIVNEEEFNKNTNQILYRGIKAESKTELDKYINSFLKGNMFNKYSAYGSGSYFTISSDLASNTYANKVNSIVITAKLKDNSKILKIDKGNNYNKEVQKLFDRLKNENTNPNDINPRNVLIQDIGLLAAINGYSAIDMTKSNMQQIMLILDRSKLEVLK